MSCRRLAVLVAAGDGQRLGRPEGKSLVPLTGRPLFLHSVAHLAGLAGLEALAVVVRPGDEARVREILEHAAAVDAGRQRVQLLIAQGGPSRQASVRSGLQALAKAGHAELPAVVLIHDAARPLVTSQLATAVAEAAEAQEGCVVGPAVEVVDTLRWRVEQAGAPAEVPPRTDLRQVQTPQAGWFDELLAAHDLAAATGLQYSDDLTLGQASGLDVRLIPGHRSNLKVTEPEDLVLAESLLKACCLPRTGLGFDVHPLVEGLALRLGGVTIPFTHGLLGHSDADVAVHAAMDAILGATGSGDIGAWFPPTDPQWRGADSLAMLTLLWARLAATGLLMGNLDLLIAAEEPRLSTHFPGMRQALAGALAVDQAMVNFKATTTERLGFVGRGEGIAAMATVTVFAPSGWRPSRAGEPIGV